MKAEEELFMLKETIANLEKKISELQETILKNEDKQIGLIAKQQDESNAIRYNVLDNKGIANGKFDDVDSQLASVDELAIELYEANASQEEVNEAQDEAIIEIYELLEQ